jgi:predicted cupin superfamily sugar epimerase
MAESQINIQELIRFFDLQPLPVEGGLFRVTYRSPEMLPAGTQSERYGTAEKPFGNAILYMVTDDPDSFSALHRLPTDEIWHFYLGDPLEMTLLYPDGSSKQVLLGQDIFNGQYVQFVAPRDVWQGTRLVPGGRFALVGTTMAPGYTDNDYQAGDRAVLQQQYPQEFERIQRLTR